MMYRTAYEIMDISYSWQRKLILSENGYMILAVLCLLRYFLLFLISYQYRHLLHKSRIWEVSFALSLLVFPLRDFANANNFSASSTNCL